MQERQVKEQQIEYAKKILKIQEQLKTSLAQVQYTCKCSFSEAHHATSYRLVNSIGKLFQSGIKLNGDLIK